MPNGYLDFCKKGIGAVRRDGIVSVWKKGSRNLVKKAIGSGALKAIVEEVYLGGNHADVPLAPRFASKALFKSLAHGDYDVRPEHFKGRAVYILTDQELGGGAELKLGKIIRTLEDLSNEEISRGVFYVYFLCDSDVLPLLARIRQCGGLYVPHQDSGKTSYRFVNRLALNAMQKTWAQRLRISHLNRTIHENICEALWLTRRLAGDYVEVGVYLGGSALTAINFLDEMKAAKIDHLPKKVWLLDTYEGFTYEEAYQSSDVRWAGTHALFGKDKTIDYIQETLAHSSQPRALIAGNICQDELPREITGIAVANIDVDMYEPTLAALKKVSAAMVPGGIIICEDPAGTPSLYGALLAMEEFLASAEGTSYLKVFKFSQYFLIKQP